MAGLNTDLLRIGGVILLFISKDLLNRSGCDPKLIQAVSASTIGPCMLPVDKEGEPLMNAVLYGVDTRAYKEIEYLK